MRSKGGNENEHRVSSEGRGVQGWWVGVLGSLFNTREMEVKWEDFTPPVPTGGRMACQILSRLYEMVMVIVSVGGSTVRTGRRGRRGAKGERGMVCTTPFSSDQTADDDDN